MLLLSLPLSSSLQIPGADIGAGLQLYTLIDKITTKLFPKDHYSNENIKATTVFSFSVVEILLL